MRLKNLKISGHPDRIQGKSILLYINSTCTVKLIKERFVRVNVK